MAVCVPSSRIYLLHRKADVGGDVLLDAEFVSTLAVAAPGGPAKTQGAPGELGPFVSEHVGLGVGSGHALEPELCHRPREVGPANDTAAASAGCVSNWQMRTPGATNP